MTFYRRTDLDDLDPGDGSVNVSGRASRLFEHLGRIARAASVRPTGETAVTPIGCRRRPGRKPCKGRIRVRRLDVPSTVQWECPHCGDSGEIINVRGSEWDLGAARVPLPEDEEGQQEVKVRITEQQYGLLSALPLLMEPESEWIVAKAEPAPDGDVRLTGPLDFWELLVWELAAAANHEESRTRQRRLNELCRQLGNAVEAQTGFRV